MKAIDMGPILPQSFWRSAELARRKPFGNVNFPLACPLERLSPKRSSASSAGRAWGELRLYKLKWSIVGFFSKRDTADGADDADDDLPSTTANRCAFSRGVLACESDRLNGCCVH